MRDTYGTALRTWRSARRLSQLELATVADVSQRHVSFLETGRAKPSREMVIHLAIALDVPRRDRNTMLAAAGYAPEYPERGLAEPALDQARALDARLAAGEDIGPLGGLPVAIKDLVDTAGIRTTHGSPLFADHVPERDALHVTRLKSAGCAGYWKSTRCRYSPRNWGRARRFPRRLSMPPFPGWKVSPYARHKASARPLPRR